MEKPQFEDSDSTIIGVVVSEPQESRHHVLVDDGPVETEHRLISLSQKAV
jgi:hypothetical protein